MFPTLSCGSETLLQVRCRFGSLWHSKWPEFQPTHPSRTKFFDRVDFYGHPAEPDRQGRLSSHTRLHGSAGMEGKGDVFGLCDDLAVWNHDRFIARLAREPYTDEDARAV